MKRVDELVVVHGGGGGGGGASTSLVPGLSLLAL